MPNFDALRSSIIGPLEYICRPKLAPVELLGCWPLGVNDTADKSRYSSGVLVGGAAVWNTDYSLPLLTYSSFPLSFNLEKPLDFSQDFSIEYMFCGANEYTTNTSLVIGDMALQAIRTGSNGCRGYLIIGSTNTAMLGTWNVNVINHVALYRQNGVLYAAVNGSAVAVNANWSLTGTYSSASFTSGAGCAGACNFRFTQKGIGTSMSFPVPATLYTGYETL